MLSRDISLFCHQQTLTLSLSCSCSSCSFHVPCAILSSFVFSDYTFNVYLSFFTYNPANNALLMGWQHHWQLQGNPSDNIKNQMPTSLIKIFSSVQSYSYTFFKKMNLLQIFIEEASLKTQCFPVEFPNSSDYFTEHPRPVASAFPFW